MSRKYTQSQHILQSRTLVYNFQVGFHWKSSSGNILYKRSRLLNLRGYFICQNGNYCSLILCQAKYTSMPSSHFKRNSATPRRNSDAYAKFSFINLKQLIYQRHCDTPVAHENSQTGCLISNVREMGFQTKCKREMKQLLLDVIEEA